jgi:hypothetical protein
VSPLLVRAQNTVARTVNAPAHPTRTHACHTHTHTHTHTKSNRISSSTPWTTTHTHTHTRTHTHTHTHRRTPQMWARTRTSARRPTRHFRHRTEYSSTPSCVTPHHCRRCVLIPQHYYHLYHHRHCHCNRYCIHQARKKHLYFPSRVRSDGQAPRNAGAPTYTHTNTHTHTHTHTLTHSHTHTHTHTHKQHQTTNKQTNKQTGTRSS